MSEIILAEAGKLVVPTPRVPIAIRAAGAGDLAFIDGLQKKHVKAVGWMPRVQLEASIAAGKVLVAEEVQSDECGVQSEERWTTNNGQRTKGTPVGYCMGADRYFKRDDVGIIYQMNVEPGRQRGLVGACLLKAQFERSAYGCKLYCCWCAQDLAANKFWEAMGFVALAFRTGGTGSGKKGAARMHIFWQKRIRSGDVSTPWWFPSETSSGAIRENRIVLPIPPGTHWSDAKPIVLPGLSGVEGPGMEMDGSSRALSVLDPEAQSRRAAKAARVKKVAEIPVTAISSGGFRFGPVVTAIEAKAAKPEKKERAKNDPRLVAAARELKDRWLEQVNAGLYLPDGGGKYDVSRTLSGVEGSRQVEGRGAVRAPLQIEQKPMAA